MNYYKGYIPTVGKVAITKWKTHYSKEIPVYSDYAGILSHEVILIDIDEMTQAELVLKVIKETEVKCRVLRTDRGMHFLFKAPTLERANNSHQMTPIGVLVDTKDGRKASYEALRVNGKEREIILDTTEPDIVPKWLLAIRQCKKDFTNMLGMKEGEGRNDVLFRNLFVLQANGWQRSEVIDFYKNIVNQYVLADPMSDYEMDSLTREELFKKEEEKEKFNAEKEANELLELFHVKRFNNLLWYYNGTNYEVFDDRKIEGEVIERHKGENLLSRQRQEVIKYLKGLKTIPEAETASEKYISFDNGILDITAGELLVSSPEFFIQNHIPHNYTKSDSNMVLNEFMEGLTQGNKDVEKLIYEMIGYCFLSRNELRKAFILYGDGANGKSTLLKLIRRVIGDKNCSAVSLEALGRKFENVMLYGKLANLGDDIDRWTSSSLGDIKKVVSGDEMLLQQKNEKAFNASLYCKCIFSSNTLPRMEGVDTVAINSRFVIVPLTADFSKSANPFIIDELKEETVVETVIYKAIESLQEVLRKREFTMPTVVEEANREFRIENDSVKEWLIEVYEDDFEKFALLCRTENLVNVYTGYTVWAKTAGIKPVQRKTFKRRLMNIFNCISGNTALNGQKRVFISLGEYTDMLYAISNGSMKI